MFNKDRGKLQNKYFPYCLHTKDLLQSEKFNRVRYIFLIGRRHLGSGSEMRMSGPVAQPANCVKTPPRTGKHGKLYLSSPSLVTI